MMFSKIKSVQLLKDEVIYFPAKGAMNKMLATDGFKFSVDHDGVMVTDSKGAIRGVPMTAILAIEPDVGQPEPVIEAAPVVTPSDVIPLKPTQPAVVDNKPTPSWKPKK